MEKKFRYLIFLIIILLSISCGNESLRFNGGNYEGETEDGVPSGYGSWTNDDGSQQYIGFWYYGKKQGTGTLTYGKYIYVGQLKNNKFNGYGELSYKDRILYAGEWVNGKRAGKGIIKDSIGKKIIGNWNADTLVSGKRIDSLGIYNGQFDKYGLANGHGSYLDKEGNYYEGHWTDDKRNIFGFSVTANKGLRAGEWRNDSYLGERIVYTSDRIYGIDISKYQHETTSIVSRRIKVRRHRRRVWKTVKRLVVHRYGINWDRLRVSHLGTMTKKNVSGKADFPISFVYVKCTEGVSIYNIYYASDCSQIRKHGIHAGSYHFFSPLSDATTQAHFFLRYASFHKGDFPPVLDVEPTHKQIEKMGGCHVLFNRIRTWMRIVENRTGVRPILYVSQIFVNRYLSMAPDIKNNYMIWIARYGEYKPDVKLIYWQLCPDGNVSGIRGKVDINVFNGYRTQFDEFIDNNCFK